MKNKHPFFLLAVIPLAMCFYSCKSGRDSPVASGARPELVKDNYEFTEGPAVDADGNVYFTDQPNDRILKWNAGDGSIQTFMQPSGRANGLYVDKEGNLLAAADEKFELRRISPDKKVTVLVDSYEGEKLNGPNDLWIDPVGGIYFTDPYYQRAYWTRTSGEIGKQQVYYLDRDTGELRLAATGFEQPNGIIGTPDGKTLYIADIGAGKTFSFEIAGDGSLTGKKLFCEMGSDGMTIDNEGNVYLTGNGVTIFNKEGKKLLKIDIPQKWTANATFGGRDRDLLFITASNALYMLKMEVRGAD